MNETNDSQDKTLKIQRQGYMTSDYVVKPCFVMADKRITHKILFSYSLRRFRIKFKENLGFSPIRIL